MSTQKSNELPVFDNLNSFTSYVPYYGYIGCYVATIVSFDPVRLLLIQNYNIISQPVNLNTNQGYFMIDQNGA